MMDRYNRISKEIDVLWGMVSDAYRDLDDEERKEVESLLLNIDTFLYLKDIDVVERSLG